MRRLPNGHVRPDSNEKRIFAAFKRIVKGGQWFTFRIMVNRLAEMGIKITRPQFQSCREMLSWNDSGFMVEEQQIGETPKGKPVFKYRIIGQRQTHANH
jgi:hypothetical protein